MPIYLKIDSGMHRLGIASYSLATCLKRLEISQAVGKVTLMTHFADADEPHGIAVQLARFKRITEGLSMPISICNSAALLRFPEAVACGPLAANENWRGPASCSMVLRRFPRSKVQRNLS